MTTQELSIATVDALVIYERAKFERNVTVYKTAMTALFAAILGTDKPALWRAIAEAGDAECELTGKCEITAKLHDETVTCDCYVPGDPCSARTDCEYCREKCPLK